MNLFIKQEQIHRFQNLTEGYTGETMRGRDKLGGLDWHIHTTLYR